MIPLLYVLRIQVGCPKIKKQTHEENITFFFKISSLNSIYTPFSVRPLFSQECFYLQNLCVPLDVTDFTIILR